MFGAEARKLLEKSTTSLNMGISGFFAGGADPDSGLRLAGNIRPTGQQTIERAVILEEEE
jgi:hypothetical protein